MTNTALVWQHFGFDEEPFGVTPDPRYVHFNARFRPAVAALYEAIQEGRCFGVIAGPPGTGKTTLANYLLQQLGEATDVVHLDCAFSSEEELLHGVMASMGVPPSRTASSAIGFDCAHTCWSAIAGPQGNSHLRRGAPVESALLESVRLFWNLETTRDKLVQIVLLGQPALLQTIRSREMDQISQRLTVVYEFPPLEEREVKQYIEHRLAKAGVERSIFQNDAVPRSPG